VTFDYKDYRLTGVKKTNDTDTSGIYQAFCFTYFAQTLYFVSSPFGLGCQDPTLWFFEQYPVKTGQAVETAKVEAFTGETQG
jgi:hypothetical protein